MAKFRIIPRLEIKGMNLIKGMRMEGLKVVGNPIEFAQKYYLDGADEIIYDDIVATLYDRKINLNLIKQISNNIHIPFCVGGRIQSLKDIRDILKSGASKVFINSYIFKNSRFVLDAAKKYGSQCIAVCIHYKILKSGKVIVLSESGRENQFIDLFDWIKFINNSGAGEILLISINNDGMGMGIDRDLIIKARKLTNLPLLIGGGISKLSHIKNLIELRCNGVLISKSLHYNEIKLNNLKKYSFK